MSEDEAFIRKIVDSPGDDLPRLVYADWLDERDDPRGAYLRAEAEWAKTKQTTGFLVLRLHGLAEGLDPVWVARVSRPPEGVCCDHLRFSDCGPRLTASGIDALEKRIGLALPSEYRGFLMNTNGGTPAPATYQWTDAEARDFAVWPIEYFHSLVAEGGPKSSPGGRSLFHDHRYWASRFPDEMKSQTVIGYDTADCCLFLRTASPHRGRVVALNTVFLDGWNPVAPSFPALLASIQEYSEQ